MDRHDDGLSGARAIGLGLILSAVLWLVLWQVWQVLIN